MEQRNVKQVTPLQPGRYWYTTLGLPDGVTAEAATTADGDGVRFMFTTRTQSMQLANRLQALATEITYGVGVPEGAEPPDVPARPKGLGGSEAVKE